MDQEHTPSSPLQHHRSTSHHNAQPNEAPNVETAKLAPASGVPRPQSGLNSPSNASSSMPWSPPEDSPVNYVDECRSGQSGSWRDTSGDSWDDGMRTQPMASSSRCVSPTTIPGTLASISEAHLSHLASQAGPLCTSEPLSRPGQPFDFPSSSTNTPRHHIPKRARASSLPESAPLNKRVKAAPSSAALSPFDDRRLHVAQPKERQYASHEARAESLRRSLRRGEIKTSTPPTPTSSVPGNSPPRPYMASHIPPVNMKSLQPLDAQEMMRNPQLRHDLLFDSLAFRPISVALPYPALKTLPEVVKPKRYNYAMQSDDERLATNTNYQSDMYWETLRAEIETGCRCVRFDVRRGYGRRERVLSCECGGWMRDRPESEWSEVAQGRWKSRLPEAILTLRQILVSLMGSTTPCPTHFAHSLNAEARAQHEATCPTITHALVPEVYKALDPEFIALQVRRGVFGLGIFELIGEAMKVHCAPVRDELVDNMVGVALSGDVTTGLRRCFDCVEVMKLDIANHQVHALRPYLWSSALNHERSVVDTILQSSKTTYETSYTKMFTRDASQRVLYDTSPKDRIHMIGACSCPGFRLAHRTGFIIESITELWIELIFKNWEGPNGPWPPLFQKDFGYSRHDESSAAFVPETMRLDSRRIKNFHVEVTDLAVNQVILLAFKEMMSTSLATRLTRPEVERQLCHANDEITYFMGKQIQKGVPLVSFDGIDTSVAMTDRQPLARTFGNHSDIALNLAIRLHRLDFPDAPTPKQKASGIKRIAGFSSTFDMYIKTNVKPDSAVFLDQYMRLKRVIQLCLSHHLLGKRYDPASLLYDAQAFVGDLEWCRRRGREDLITDDDDVDIASSNDLSTVTPTNAGNTNTPNDNTDPIPVSRSRQPTNSQFTQWQEWISPIEKRMIRRNGMETIYPLIQELVKDVGKVASFNLAAFMGVYSSPGMIIGS